MLADLAWIGLDWDAVEIQSQHRARHEAALDRLAALGRLYPSPISRRDLEALGRRAPDGAWAYDNRERGRALPSTGWRGCAEPLRVRLDDGVVALADESGLDLTQDPSSAFGDPLVRRRDGAIAYHLAVVVDDAAVGVTRVVRGRDIAPSTATQVALQRLLDLPLPTYRHHLLLLEQREKKLAKLHGAVGATQLRAVYSGPQLCGWLAWCAGLCQQPNPCAPADLLKSFTWERVRRDDRLVHWTGERLELDNECGDGINHD